MGSRQAEPLGARDTSKKRSASVYEVEHHEPTSSTGKAKRLRTEYSYMGRSHYPSDERISEPHHTHLEIDDE